MPKRTVRSQAGRRRRPSPARRRPTPRRNPLATVAIALAALLLTAFAAVELARWLVPPVPKVEKPKTLSMDEARADNAAVPFVEPRLIPARPYRFQGSPAARLQAIDCLATAALYEAGDDVHGQQAVIQVVLNRVRTPGFPKTVCGVVYQGAQRTTGCQFSFTCDGSIRRRPEHAGWTAARETARRALAGHVFVNVGRATHYHTDWMVPYWRGSLAKIAQVGTHIFYRRGTDNRQSPSDQRPKSSPKDAKITQN
jgi:hypothetical protein